MAAALRADARGPGARSSPFRTRFHLACMDCLVYTHASVMATEV
jgi:hypothetical protein